eukprot:TRINITY_DN7450_c0_g1_i1.p1 TRINITY_DN7450_c0_g1~~TRINITY_DN7450_c0_g1_i1.p1  ORF type:complete len:396 (+),score=66.68 TRINITY_DN7450_c0_g1_i1:110-1189(+)
MSVVTIAYEDLKDPTKDLSAQIQEGYGPNGLGAITISGIPNFVEARKKLLPMAHTIAHLPEEEQKKLEHEDSMYNVGWSLGKEKIGDKPDLAKGSYYCNPVFDNAATSEEELKKYPWACPPNIWPTETVPEMEAAFKNLGKIMYDVIVLLTAHVDKFISANVKGYKRNHLYNAMSTTRKIKGRLLYYYPQADVTEDGWIGWHNDSGFLTGLTGSQFINDETAELIDNPDPEGGLYIINRAGGSVRVRIPSDHMAIQCGECLQIVSGGCLVATPHCVRASKPKDKSLKVGRMTFPVFVDTPPNFPLSMPEGCAREDVFDKTVNSKVPPLQKRWTKDGVEFADFLGDTFKQYYEWSLKQKS